MSEKQMGRKERCPKCGSKKVDVYSTPKRCKVCKFTWSERERELKLSRKTKSDFDGVKKLDAENKDICAN